MKLISMTDFVLEQSESIESDMLGYGEFIDKVVKYAKFLKQPLTLGMFIPCDEDDNVLIEPLHYKEWCKKSLNVPYCLDLSKYEQYQQSKESVLFEGFELSQKNLLKHNWCKIFFLKHKNGNTYFEVTDFTKEELPEKEVKTIEDLIIVFNLALTLLAIKQIGL